MRHTAEYTVRCVDEARARAIAAAIAVEAGDPLPNATVHVQQSGDVVRLKVIAEDVPHLRAATNSYLKWLITADGALDQAGG